MNNIINLNKKTGDTFTATEFNNVIASINNTYSDLTNNTFSIVSAVKNQFTIDWSSTPFAEITLGSLYDVYNLYITNYVEGSCGKIIVHQTGFKKLVTEDSVGEIDLPIAENTMALITYFVVKGTLYVSSSIIIPNGDKQLPATISDLSVVYSNLQMATLLWTSPYSGVDGETVTSYDIRYSSSPLNDPNSASDWSSATRVTLVVTPLPVGLLQTITLTGLKAELSYYVYVKSNKLTNNVTYTSYASSYAFFVTKGSSDTSVYYLLPLSTNNIIAQSSVTGADINGNTVDARQLIVDELDKTKYLASGYPDLTSNNGYSTGFGYNEYSRNLIMPELIFDLKTTYTLDKAYITSGNKGEFRVYASTAIGGDWDYIGDYSVYFSDWITVDFQGKDYRFFKIAWDTIYKDGSGEYAFPSDRDYNGSITPILNVLLYGKGSNTLLVNILPPKRRSFEMRTVDDFFCVDGHAYQLGRIHSMVSGPKIRLYIHYGLFDAQDDNGNSIVSTFKDLADVKFKCNDIGWVTGNDGTGDGLVDNLKNTYLKYGMKPYLTATGYSGYTRYTNDNPGRPVDDYWLPGAWRPVPKLEIDGFIPYYNITRDANHYMTLAKLAYTLAAKFGSVQISALNIPIYRNSSSSASENSTDSGLDLICGIEPGNEIDKSWRGFSGYADDKERFALCSACYDGICNTLIDVSGYTNYGMLNADPSLLFINPGDAGMDTAEPFTYYSQAIKTRKDKAFPCNVLAQHIYCTNSDLTGAITFEDWHRSLSGLFFENYIDFRDRYFPYIEIWVNEFGYGEGGLPVVGAKYQCYSLNGKIINGWNIPDRFRGDIKGAWTIRACIEMMSMGVTLINYYSTEMEENAFANDTNGSGGIGMEMWHWNDTTSTTPGAHVLAVAPYVNQCGEGGYACMGIFGSFLDNGAFPITRSYWYIATFRNTLKDYYFIGWHKLDTDSKIKIACFKKKGDESKGAYVIYYDTSDNDGVHNVEIPVPSNVDKVTHVTTYVPELIDPTTVPQDVLFKSADINRTGMVGATHTIVSGVETVTLPTKEENPYFPLIGPVAALNINKLGGNNYYGANAFYETKYDSDNNPVYEYHEAASLAWKLVEAVCDYIDYSEEGLHGIHGDSTTIDATGGFFVTDVTEFPEYYLFDAVPTTTFTSSCTDLIANVINSSTIDLYWNNNNYEDTQFNIFQSFSPETGYTLVDTVPAGSLNYTEISNLTPNTHYYFKVLPMRNSDLGTLSDYVSAITDELVEAPLNVLIVNRGLTTLTLSWEGDYSLQYDFIQYAIYRAQGNGSFQLVASIKDKTIKLYIDTELTSGTYYSYKIKAECENGSSPSSSIVTNRTLLPTEVSPKVQKAYTNKIGTLVILVFDLNLQISDSNLVLNNLSLTEDGNSRLIKSCYIDSNNLNTLILSVADGSLAEYENKTLIRLSYTSNIGLQSVYGILVDSFSNQIITNMIGNYTNINGIYYVNFVFSGNATDLPADTKWNNIIGDPGLDSTHVSGIGNIPSQTLTDEYARTSDIRVTPILTPHSSPSSLWYGANAGNGNICKISGIDIAVADTRWKTHITYSTVSNVTSSSILNIMGLNTNYNYDIEIYGMQSSNGNDTIRFKIGNTYSNQINVDNNATDTMKIESIVPSSDGTMNVSFERGTDSIVNADIPINFMIITEYTNYEEPTNHEPYVLSVLLNDNLDTNPTDNDINKLTGSVHIAYIGVYTYYLISDNDLFNGSVWTAIDSNDPYNLPFTLSNWGNENVYVKLKNNIGESNIKSVSFTATKPKDIEINSITIDQGASLTDLPTVNVSINAINQVATNYMISEDQTFSGSISYPFLLNITFVLSSNVGVHTIYAKVSSDNGETWSTIKSQSIELIELNVNSISIENGNLVHQLDIIVDVLYTGFPTHYYLTTDATFATASAIPFTTSNIPFTLSDNSVDALYLKLLNSIVTTSAVSVLFTSDFSTSNVLFSIQLPSYIDASTVSLSFPTFKYDKKTIYTQSTDDSYTLLNRFSNFVRGRDVNVGTGNWAQWVHTDGSGNDTTPYPNYAGNIVWWTPPYPLTFSDGCGNFIYPANSAIIWPGQANYMLNYQLDWMDMLDFGISPNFHDVWDPYNDPTGSNGYGQNQQLFNNIVSATNRYVHDNFVLRYMKIILIPNGNANYINYTLNCPSIAEHIFDEKALSTFVYPYQPSFTLKKSGIVPAREFWNNDTEVLDAMNYADPTIVTNKQNRMWSMIGNHRLGNEYLNNLGLLYNTRLNGGDDDTWVVSDDEYYEWWYMKNNSTILTQVSGNIINCNVAIPQFYNFYYPSISLLCNNIYDNQSKSIDTLVLNGTANCNGTCSISRGQYSDTINYSSGDSAESLALQISKSTKFLDSTISRVRNKVIFTSNLDGKVDTPTFIDNAGSKQQVTFTLTGTVSVATLIQFHIDFMDNDLYYTPTINQTAIQVCNAIKIAWLNSVSMIGWDLDTTNGTNTLVFTKKYEYIADTPTFTGNCGLNCTSSVTQVGSPKSGITGIWLRSIAGLNVSGANCEYLSYGIDENDESCQYETDRLTITQVPSMAGNITIRLNDQPFTYTLSNTYSTTALLAQFLSTQTYTGWTVSYVSGNSFLDFTSNNIGKCITPAFNPNSTGTIATFLVITYGTEHNVIINVDCGSAITTAATKYVNRYVNNLTRGNGLDAEYFVNLLSDLNSNKQTLQDTLDTYLREPIITDLILNNGVSTISNMEIPVLIVCDFTPSQYMLSDNPSFTGATWVAYTSGMSYTITDVAGLHTIYAKVKNGNKTSNTVYGSITYSPPQLVLNSFLINNGLTTTTSLDVSLTYTYSGSSPIWYMASEDNTFNNGTWVSISNSIVFTLSRRSGAKTIYFKLKNNNFTTDILSATITYNAPLLQLTSIVLGDGSGGTNNLTIPVTINYTGGEEDPTGYKLSELSDFSDVSGYTVYSQNVVYYTFNSYGAKTLYCQLTDGTTVSTLNSSITVYLQLSLSNVSINNGALQTNVSSVTVDVTYSGLPTQYMIGEDSLFSGCTWLTFTTSAIQYELTNIVDNTHIYGTHELYVKLTNGYNITQVMKSTIMYTYSALTNILLANIPSDLSSTSYGYINSMSNAYSSDRNYYNTQGIQAASYVSPNLNQNWCTETPYLKWPQMTGRGLLLNFSSISQTPSDCSLPSKSGYYPNDYIWNSTNKYTNTLNVWPSVDGTANALMCSSYVLANLPQGYYKVRVLLNSSNFYGSQLNIKCNMSEVQTIDTSKHNLYCNNNDNWIVFNNISVSSDLSLLLMFNDPTTTTSIPYTSLVSFIEITLQNYVTPASTISFKDPNVKLICVTNFDTNHDGEISTAEAAAVTYDLMKDKIHMNPDITSFDEFIYFTGVTALDNHVGAYSCVNISSIHLPAKLYAIWDNPFSFAKFTRLVIPGTVTTISVLQYIDKLTHLIFQDSNANLQFTHDKFLRPASNGSITTLVLPARTTSIVSELLGWVDTIRDLYVKATTPPTLGGDIGGSLLHIYVPAGCSDAYKAAANWSSKASIISEYTTIPAEYDTIANYDINS